MTMEELRRPVGEVEAEALAWELRLGNPNVHVVEVVKVCPESQC